MSGFWEGCRTLLLIAFFFGLAKGVSYASDGIPRVRVYRNAILAAAIFAGFSYLAYGYHVEGTDRLMGVDSEIVENDVPKHPTSRLDLAVKVFVICAGCFCYAVYRSDPNKKTETVSPRSVYPVN